MQHYKRKANTMESLQYGPMIEQTMLTGGMDFYKPTMSQLEYEKHPEAVVTFTFKNRADNRLADYITPQELQDRFDTLQQQGFTKNEIDYFASLTTSAGEPLFSKDYLNYIATTSLPPVHVELDPNIDDLAITAEGEWPMVTFWETIVLSEVNETYYVNKIRADGIDVEELYKEGDRRLSQKIAYFLANPDVKFSDFGTRRRFSQRWHKHVVERLAAECPDNFVGTSNVALSAELGLKPIGTFAHELPMVYAGIADAKGQDIKASHGQMLDDWYGKYGDDLGTALSDTFGSNFFFEDFSLKRSTQYKGTRQDSGDPIAYARKAITHYKNLGLDPAAEKITFSDSLNIVKIDHIKKVLADTVIKFYGIGTDLTHDVGVKPGNNVMKGTHVLLPSGQEADLVKLSDDPEKHTGPVGKVALYQTIFVKGDSHEHLALTA